MFQKFIVFTFCLIAIVAADVSHLNNQYLPPDTKHAAASSPIEDAVAHHVTFAAKIAEEAAASNVDSAKAEEPKAAAEPAAKEAKNEEPKHEASAPEEQVAQPEAPAVDLVQIEAEQSQEPAPAVAPAPAPAPAPVPASAKPDAPEPAESQVSGFDIPALPEVSNGIDTRYGSNGGYIY